MTSGITAQGKKLIQSMKIGEEFTKADLIKILKCHSKSLSYLLFDLKGLGYIKAREGRKKVYVYHRTRDIPQECTRGKYKRVKINARKDFMYDFIYGGNAEIIRHSLINP